MIKKVISLFFLWSLASPLGFLSVLQGQTETDSTEMPFGFIFLDPLVVTASRSDFNVEDFVELVRKDESFYRAFRNIRTLSYSADNQIELFSKRGKKKASYHSKTRQHSDGTCRTMDILEEQSQGNFYKRQKRYRYYTAKLFDRLFFTHGKICESKDGTEHTTDKKGMEKHVSELKKLIFSPGEKANVPIIGKKTAIFSERMAKYYDFSIQSKKYKNGENCYVFVAQVKPDYLDRKEGKTVIKHLETYFEKSNFQVVARSYQLKYFGALFDFDVQMNIALSQVEGYYVPKKIQYEGWWNVPTKKREVANFTIDFYDYQVP